MNKIIDVNNLENLIDDLKKDGKKIVLAGGCFDVLHKGHLEFIKSAKEKGDILILLLESDQSVSRKGINRPFNNQKYRSIVLSSIKFVDYVIPLKGMTKNEEYDKLIVQIQPDIIAMTEGDRNYEFRKKQAKLVNAKVEFVTKHIDDLSTTKLMENKI